AMAAVRLTRYECERNLFPRVCARCGLPADRTVRYALLSPNSNLALGFLLSFCPPLFLYFLFRERARRGVEVPMCKRDADDWHWRDRLTIGTYMLLVVNAYCAAIALAVFSPVWDYLDGRFVLLAYFGVVYVWLPILLLWTRTIRTSKVMKHGIRLSGVHPEFVRALMADRMRTRESDPQRLAWYGDDRDDFEEDWNADGAFRPDVSTSSEPRTERSGVNGQACSSEPRTVRSGVSGQGGRVPGDE
ncbi:MAG TPA: hypothetical protein VKD71_00905, partial [Gemmataceae bacterium]|nr:hypothetical protein [Gemmataceae bacterium]